MIISRVFGDMIKVWNPGNLPEGITPENIAGEQHSRNPTIAAVLAKVEYIEELGEGWDKIIKEHPLSPDLPNIESSEHSVTVTIFSTKEKFEEEREVELNERQEKALEYLKEHKKITNRKYRKINPDISDRTALRDLEEMREKNIVERKGEGRKTHYELV